MSRWRSLRLTTLGYLTWGFCLGVLSMLMLKGISKVISSSMIQEGKADPPVRVNIWKQKGRNYTAKNGYVAENTSAADDSFRRVKVLCFVMVSADQASVKRSIYQKTWGKRCDRLLLFSNQTVNEDIITLDIPKPNQNFAEDPRATIQALRHIYAYHVTHAQWFIKLYPVTYIVLENLRYFLSEEDYTKPIYFGQILRQNDFLFPLGPGGYVMSREAVSIFGIHSDKEACIPSPVLEDVMMGRCFEKLGIHMGDSRDAAGRSRFHGISVESVAIHEYPAWFRQLDVYSELTKQGISSVSDYAITFSPVSDGVILAMDYFLYTARLYGRHLPSTSVNRKKIKVNDNLRAEQTGV